MKAQLALAWALAGKDLLLFRSDRRAALLCFAVPVLLAAAFGAVFHRPGGVEALRPVVAVVAEDDSPLTRRIVDAFCASERVDAHRSDRAAAVAELTANRGGVVLVLPPGFGTLAEIDRRSATPTVQLLHAPGSTVESRWVEAVFCEVALREAAAEALGSLRDAGLAVPTDRPFNVERVAAYGPSGAFNTYSHSFCGMTLQYLLFWGMDSGLLLLRDRRQGVWRRLRVAPLPLPTLLAGKALATALIALAQIAVCFLFGWLAFGVAVAGSPAGFAVLAVAAAALAAATGLLVAALGGNEGRARSVAILAILVLSMLGGLWLPSFLLPRWAQTLALALPTTWAARGFEGVTWQGLGLAEALRCAAVLFAFSAAFLLAAWLGFIRAERRRTEGGAA